MGKGVVILAICVPSSFPGSREGDLCWPPWAFWEDWRGICFEQVQSKGEKLLVKT